MIDFLVGLLGNYTFESFSLILTFLEGQLCISMFCPRLRKRSFFALRIVIALLEGIILCYLLAIWNTEAGSLPVRVICYLVIILINLGFLAFCWDDSPEQLLMAFSSGTAAYQIGNKLFPLIQNLLGVNDRTTISLSGNLVPAGWEWLLFFAFRFGVYYLLAFLFHPRSRLSSDSRTRWNTVALSAITVSIVTVLVCIARVYEGESMTLNIVVKVFAIAFSLVVLLLSRGIFTRSEHEEQINVLNQLMKQEKTQFENVKAHMDVINMKCHDLKHILGKIEGKLTEGEADSLREAIEFYDSNIKTGNEVLDVVLCEKAMTCQKNGIAFSCMADGRNLDFLTPVQIYSLFGNIIDNAVEAVSKLTDETRKVISLTVTREGDSLVIEESNYFDGQLKISDGLPETGKADSSRHGYGTRSIQYIAQQYSGTMDISAQGEMFFLNVVFPLKKE